MGLRQETQVVCQALGRAPHSRIICCSPRIFPIWVPTVKTGEPGEN